MEILLGSNIIKLFLKAKKQLLILGNKIVILSLFKAYKDKLHMNYKK